MRFGPPLLSSALILGLTSLVFLPGSKGSEDRALLLSEARVSDPLPGPTPSEAVGRAADAEIQQLQSELSAILTSTGNRTGNWGVLAVSLDRGDTLLSLNPGTPLTPASNEKLLTTAAALFALGPNFRYTTFLLARGPIQEGVLDGDLVFYGTGDPTISSRFYRGEMGGLEALADELLAAGVTEVTGDLVVDGSYFTGPEIHPEWDPADLNDPFAAPVSAVSFNENLVTVRVEAGTRAGRPPLVHTMPQGSGIPVLNTAMTKPVGTRSRIWLFRETPWDPIGIEGEIPVGGRDVWRQLPVPDPLVFTGREFERVLQERGFLLQGELRVNRDPARSVLPADGRQSARGGQPVRILVAHESPPLLDIIRVVNKESHNLFAETVGRTLGRMAVGRGSFQGLEAAVTRFLIRDVGVDPASVRVRDGSGLSPENRVSAGAFIQVLEFMSDSPLWDDLWSTLPEAGVRGEMRRMGGSPASRNLRAKTGTMDGVSALSGMVRTRSGERVLFSVISNDVASEIRAKRAEDQLGIRLASLTRPAQPPSPRN